MSNFALGAAAGGMAEGLDEILKRRFLEQVQRQQAAIQQQTLAQQAERDAGIERRWSTTRNDQIEADRQHRAALEQFVAANPHLAGVVQAQRVGLSIEDPHKLETDDAHAPHAAATQAARIKGIKDETTARKQAEQPFEKPPNLIQVDTGDAVHMVDPRTGKPVSRLRKTQPGDNQSGPSPQEAYADERTTRIVQSVDELTKKVSPWVTGAGSLLTYFPGSAATDFESEVESLKANIAFGELVEMRNASKTGGALGNVSDRESQLLSSTLGALNTRQSPANFKAQLQKIRGSLDRWKAAKAQYAVGPVRPDGVKDTDPLGIRK